MNRAFALLVIAMCVFASLPACGKRTIKIDRAMRKAIDTSAARQIVVLRPEMDSLCAIRTDSLIQAAVDSILGERRTEIQKITRHGE